jgi:hypothetical protein
MLSQLNTPRKKLLTDKEKEKFIAIRAEVFEIFKIRNKNLMIRKN